MFIVVAFFGGVLKQIVDQDVCKASGLGHDPPGSPRITPRPCTLSNRSPQP